MKKRTLILHYGDMIDSLSVSSIINKILPDEIYNLAAQSHVAVSFEVPEYTGNVDGLGTLRILDVIKSLRNKKKIKFYQAGTSEMYGGTQKKLKMKKPILNLKAPMLLQNFMHIGLQKFIEMLMEFLLRTVFFLIMKVLLEVRLL